MLKRKRIAVLTCAVAAFALLSTPAGAAPAPRSATKWSAGTSSTRPSLDGELAAAGATLCGSLPTTGAPMAQLSCQALQQTVQSGPYPGLWQMSQVISATLAAGAWATPSARRLYASQVYWTLSRYADGRPFSSGLAAAAGAPRGLRFYDDNAWAGLDLMLAYRESGRASLLTVAKQLFTFERSGEWRSTDPPDEQRYPGGIYWNTRRLTRPAVVGAAAAQFALDLYLVTHDRGDLEFGERVYEWVRHTLGTADGLYQNRVAPGGTITGVNNEMADGVMVGDGVLLNAITRHARYLRQAVSTAKASLKRYTQSFTEAACPAFNAIYLHNLLALKGVSRIPGAIKLLDTYAGWSAGQSDPQTGMFALSSFGSACTPPLPQAGVAGTLILPLTR